MNFNRIQEQLRVLKEHSHDESPSVRIASALGHEIPWFRPDQLDHFSTIIMPYESADSLSDDELGVYRALGVLRVAAERVRDQLQQWAPQNSVTAIDPSELAKHIYHFAHDAGEMSAPEIEATIEEISDLVVVRAVTMLQVTRRELAAALSTRLPPRARVVTRPTLELVTSICEKYRHLSSEAVAIKCLDNSECSNLLRMLHEYDEKGQTAELTFSCSSPQLSLLSHGFIEIDLKQPDTYRLSEIGKAAGEYLSRESRPIEDVQRQRTVRASAATAGQYI